MLNNQSTACKLVWSGSVPNGFVLTAYIHNLTLMSPRAPVQMCMHMYVHVPL